MKKCKKCGIPKSLNDFHKCNHTKDGKRSVCKVCTNTENRARNEKNKDQYNAHKRQYVKDHKAERHAYHKKWYVANKPIKRAKNEEWKRNNPEKYKTISQNWYAKNRTKKLKQNRKNEIKRLQIDPTFRMVKNLRNRLNKLIQGKIKSGKTLELLGCSISFFKNYLSVQFRDGMTWENYGVYWHIDHKKPCSLFDLTQEEEQRKCFHYSNMQPLLATENLHKYNKLII